VPEACCEKHLLLRVPLYAPLLTINSPSLIFAALNSFGNLGSAGVAFNIIYSFVAVPLLSGAMIFYTYRSLTRNQVTVGEAFNQANRRLLHLILVYIMFWGAGVVLQASLH
jgi:hypothetical protein